MPAGRPGERYYSNPPSNPGNQTAAPGRSDMLIPVAPGWYPPDGIGESFPVATTAPEAKDLWYLVRLITSIGRVGNIDTRSEAWV